MIILRQRIYGLTNDGGGTSSMEFYKTKKAEWTAAGGQEKLGGFTDWMKGQKEAGQGIANQTSNLELDRSSYKAKSLQAVGSNGGGGVQGKSGGGLFAFKDPNNVQHTGAYTGVQAGQQHAANANRVWADKNKYANIKKQNQAFNKGLQQGQQSGFQQGQQSVGLKQGALNTWNNMSTAGKVATGAAIAGTAALLIRNRQKRKEAEEQLARERNRR